MKNTEIWKMVMRFTISILTAVLTAIGNNLVYGSRTYPPVDTIMNQGVKALLYTLT
ncbi:MAG: hypothetical protein J6U14_01635 [Bacteroidaceae bacterium]|nr:hypothetical protein [Bacteroidaceae bacterium]